MNVYLSSRYARQEELRSYIQKFREAGHKVCSRWLTEADPAEALPHDLTDEAREQWGRVAERDYDDAVLCDVMVHFSEQPGTSWPGGGRNVELGIAIALGTPIVIVGPHENVFHYLPRGTHELVHVDNVAQAVAMVDTKQAEHDEDNVLSVFGRH